MDLHLTDKVAVVTGANKGIGLAITKALVAEGASVVAGSLSTENLDGLDSVTAVSVNLLAADGPALLVQKAIEAHGRLDVLVNNVGAVRIRVDGFLATGDEDTDGLGGCLEGLIVLHHQRPQEVVPPLHEHQDADGQHDAFGQGLGDAE